MGFTEFNIPKRAPDSQCQARIRLGGVETYCDQATNGARCPAHGARGLVQRRWAKVRQAQVVAPTPTQTAQNHSGDNGSGASLDTRIQALSAVIASLEAKAPLSLEETKLLGRLNKTLAELINARLRIERTSHALVDAEILHQRALALFDRLILDDSLRAAVTEAFGQLLDELVSNQGTNTESQQEESPDVAQLR